MTALVVAGLSAREMSRRWTALLLLISLPLWFYLVRRDLTGQSIRMLALGIGWAVSTLTLFVVNASRGVDPRLRLSGASVTSIIGGRLIAMTGAGAMLALGYWALAGFDQDLPHPWAAGLMMLVTAVVAAPFGSLVGALLPRELEGALALLSVCAVQMLADPAGLVAKFMPFWSTREIGTYAVDGGSTDMVWRGLAHAAVVWLFCAGLTLAVFARRLRVARYPEP
ncbi:ABC transporter permease [Actinoplanes aureus]|uniref:ABC transporter permease n=1 Tax=Actinoplanes aureus TaxID=2792083 RepID=A0A931CD39_9ACTN|nr:ABC transporter permease [Actinoplanes aureus]MBG0562690.1 ABC transporter permease [Actinoplanes aureus]